MMIKKIISMSVLAMVLLPQIPVSAADIMSGQKYEKKVVKTITKTFLSPAEEENLTEEEKILAEESELEKSSYETLVPKTDANYEVTLAYSDGSYSYVGNASTYDKAVQTAEASTGSLTVTFASDVVIPTVINSVGEVVYATEDIGRSWYKSNTSGRHETSNVFADPGLTDAYTYIHDWYISELPLIEDREREAKVLVAGYEGWMNKDINRDPNHDGYNNSDIVIQPINQVTNPSYYTVTNGLLKHFISTSMDTAGKGTMRTIGIAPSFLKEGQTYYSYDGNYFYDSSQGITNSLITLTRDLRNGNHNNSINSQNPYYNYYNYLPFRTKTNYTAEDLDRYINNNTQSTSKLRGLGQALKEAEQVYGVNALLALSVAINESGRGMSTLAQEKNNLFGLNATDYNTSVNATYYSSTRDCVMEFAKTYISRGYTDTTDWRDYGGFLGNKKLGANVKYASDPFWSEKAVSFAMEIELYLSDQNVANMKDYNYYQLIRYTGTNTVKTSSGNLLYNIQGTVNPGYGSFVGAVSAISTARTTSVAGVNSFEINPERTTPNSLGNFDGFYDWNIKGYINTSNIEFVNKGKNGFRDEDIDFDGNISFTDLAIVGQAYNSRAGELGWNSKYDINGDGIVDIYDLVKISRNL
ncbi:glucosaminidase domain-containing protein [Clostridium cibarium]|uniref:Glucosaminidase domain-containing protein n=1 Tax=Clostridium cibarium TaxID=2762247 RepID=A0ABR8PPT1_9CLOT|nr:glucosaminidase domain-containing protein [Clostridium cibarium]MBD7910190.1 glucosaminidase domain-containing protein [Clostridium cibarium]